MNAKVLLNMNNIFIFIVLKILEIPANTNQKNEIYKKIFEDHSKNTYFQN